VSQRIEALESGEPTESAGASAGDAEAYESFDDLIADSGEEEAAAPPPEYESFDDVVADEEDDAAPPAPQPDSEPAAQAVEAELEGEPRGGAVEPPPTEPTEPSPATPRRRRKVSFV
jgi:hypothetical protein